MKPSQHRVNAEKRISEIEAEAQTLSDYLNFPHQAGSFKALTGIYAGLADQENAERIAEQREGNTIGRALDIIETIDPNEITDGALAALVSFVLAKFVERDKPVAWARKCLNMEHTVAELADLMQAACENDGLIIGDGSMVDEYAEELACLQRAEARAINAGAA